MAKRILITPTYSAIRDSLLTRFLAGIPLSIWKSAGDEKQTFSNRFLPLLQLGLAEDNQFYGSFDDALAGFFAAMPRDAKGGSSFSDII